MTTLNLFTSYWHWNFPALIIAVFLAAFHFITNGKKFNKRSYLFMGGILLFLFTTFSPIDFLAQYYLFSAHMVKHIIILLIVPPMLLSSTDAKYLKKVVNNKHFKQIGKYIFHPIIAWVMGVGSMWLWHIPSLFALLESSPVLQIFQMISLLILGLIFIWPVFNPAGYKKLQPLQSSLYLFTACVGCTVLGIFMTFAPAGIYTPYYVGSNASVLYLIKSKWGITSAIDQQMGGLIMWVPACFVYLTNILISLTKWYQNSDNEIYTRKNPVTKKLNLS